MLPMEGVAEPPYTIPSLTTGRRLRQGREVPQMLHLSPEDVASLATVVGVLEAEVAALASGSRIVGVWRDWMDLLRPTAQADGRTAVDDRALLIVLDQVTPGGIGA